LVSIKADEELIEKFPSTFLSEMITDFLSLLIGGPFYSLSFLFDVIPSAASTFNFSVALDPLVRANVMANLLQEPKFFMGHNPSPYMKQRLAEIYGAKSPSFKTINNMFEIYIDHFAEGAPGQARNQSEVGLAKRKGEFLKLCNEVLTECFMNILDHIGDRLRPLDVENDNGISDASSSYFKWHNNNHLQEKVLRSSQVYEAVVKTAINQQVDQDWKVGGDPWLSKMAEVRELLNTRVSTELLKKFDRYLISNSISTFIESVKQYALNQELGDTAKQLFSGDSELIKYVIELMEKDEIGSQLLNLSPGTRGYSEPGFESSAANDVSSNVNSVSSYKSLLKKLVRSFESHTMVNSEQIRTEQNELDDNYEHREKLISCIQKTSSVLRSHIEMSSLSNVVICNNIYQCILHYVWLFRQVSSQILVELGMDERDFFRTLPDIDHAKELVSLSVRFLTDRYYAASEVLRKELKNGDLDKSWKNVYIPQLIDNRIFDNAEEPYDTFGFAKGRNLVISYYNVYWSFFVGEDDKDGDFNFMMTQFKSDSKVYVPNIQKADLSLVNDQIDPNAEFIAGEDSRLYRDQNYLSMGHFDALNISTAKYQSQSFGYQVLLPIHMPILEIKGTNGDGQSENVELSHYLIRQHCSNLVFTISKGSDDLSPMGRFLKTVCDPNIGYLHSIDSRFEDEAIQNEPLMEALIHIRFQRDKYEKNIFGSNIQRINDKRALRNMMLLLGLSQSGFFEDETAQLFKPLDGAIKFKGLYNSMSWHDYTLHLKVKDPFKLKDFLSLMIAGCNDCEIGKDFAYPGQDEAGKRPDEFFLPLFEDIKTNILFRKTSGSGFSFNSFYTSVRKVFIKLLMDECETLEPYITATLAVNNQNELFSMSATGPSSHKGNMFPFMTKDLSFIPGYCCDANDHALEFRNRFSKLEEILNSGILNIWMPTGYNNIRASSLLSKKLLKCLWKKVDEKFKIVYPENFSEHDRMTLGIMVFHDIVTQLIMSRYSVSTLSTSIEIDSATVAAGQKAINKLNVVQDVKDWINAYYK